MTYTRLTVIGSKRKADLVLPDDEPVGALLPQLLEMLDERVPGGREIALSTLTGVRVELDETLGEQRVDHGTMLRLLPLDDAPQPPEIVDITDAVAVAAGRRGDHWNERAGIASVATLSAVVAGIASTSAQAHVGGLTGQQGYWFPAASLFLIALATIFAHRSRTGAAAAFGAAALGIIVPALALTPQPWSLGTRIIVLAGAAWLALGAIVGIGSKQRPVLVCSGIGVLAAVLTAVGDHLAWPQLLVAVVTALTGMMLTGLVPGVALALSGLTRYDDRSMRGERSGRQDVDRAIEEGFATLTWAVIAIGLPTGLALFSLAGQESPWTTGLTPAICLVLLLRARVLPLIPQRIALLITGLTPLLAMLVGSPQLSSMSRMIIAAVALIVLLGIALIRPSAVFGAKLRRAAEVVELLLMITTIPLALGALGIYADLLETFR